MVKKGAEGVQINNRALKVAYIIIFVLFIPLLLIFILDYPLKISNKDIENVENRELAKLPVFDINKLDPFPVEFEAFYNDHFNFRDEIIKFNSLFRLKVLNVSPIEKIFEGKDGWLYTKKYIENYTNQNLFTNLETDSLLKIFNERTKWLQERNIIHYLVIVPNKPNIYPEFLPSYVKKRNKQSRTDQLIETVSNVNDLRVVDLRKSLLEEKERSKIRLFHKTDQHWNEYGALIGYLAIIKELRKDFPEMYNYTTDDFLIDSVLEDGKQLAQHMKLDEKLKEMTLKVKLRDSNLYKEIDTIIYQHPEKFPDEWGFQLYFENINSGLPKIMIIRDSFTNMMKGFLPNSFGETVLIWDNWCYELNENIVVGENPDIFMTIIVESSLPNLIYKHRNVRKDDKRL